MIDEQRKAQASRYVLGTLPLEQVREFEAAVSADFKLQALVKELSGTAGTKTATLARLGTASTLLSTAKVDAQSSPDTAAGVQAAGDSPEPAWMSWMPWAVAACFAILCIVLISIGRSLRDQAISLSVQLEEKNTHTAELQGEIEQLQSQIESHTTNHQSRLLEVQRQVVQRIQELNRQNAIFTNQLGALQSDTQRRMLAFRDEAEQLRREKKVLEEAIAGTLPSSADPLSTARLAVLRPTGEIAPNAFGSAIWSTELQRGLIVVENLPALPPSQSYHLWLITPRSPRPISAGGLPDKISAATSIKFTAMEKAEGVERFAISIEQRSGSASPTRVVLSSN